MRKGTFFPALALIVFAGVLLRVYFARVGFVSDYDTSTVGLMGMRILEGDRPLFFYGQSYMGALEAYLAAAIFSVFGVSTFTLCLAPMFFAVLWIWATGLLFREWFNAPAGLAAAMVVAFPDWFTVYYTIAAHGGYPGAFFFGTVVCWLATVVVRQKKVRYVQVALLGLFSGWGIWTHYISLAYLGTAGLILGSEILRRLRHGQVPRLVLTLPQWLLAGFLFVVGSLPLWFRDDIQADGMVSRWHANMAVVRLNVGLLFDRCFPLCWSDGLGDVLGAVWMSWACVLVVGFSAVFAWVRRGKKKWLWPWVFVVVFLVGYLPHAMGTYGAVRYMLPLWLMVVATMMATALQTRGLLYKTMWVAVFIWCGLRIAEGVQRANVRSEKAQTRKEAILHDVELARQLGARYVRLTNPRGFAVTGHTYTFYAKDRIRYVAPEDERYQPAAQAADASKDYLIGAPLDKVDTVRATLDSMGLAYHEVQGKTLVYFGQFQEKTSAGKAVLPSEITPLGTYRGKASFLQDGNMQTRFSGTGYTGWEMTFSKPVPLQGCWFFSSGKVIHDLPRNIRITALPEKEKPIEVLFCQNRAPVAYLDDSSVFFDGYWGRSEYRFGATKAKHWRVEIESETLWGITEMVWFTQTEGHGFSIETPEMEDDQLAVLARNLEKEDVDRIYAGRHLSGRLYQINPALPVLLRPNPKYPESLWYRDVPLGNHLFVIPTSLNPLMRERIENDPKSLMLINKETLNYLSLWQIRVLEADTWWWNDVLWFNHD